MIVVPEGVVPVPEPEWVVRKVVILPPVVVPIEFVPESVVTKVELESPENVVVSSEDPPPEPPEDVVVSSEDPPPEPPKGVVESPLWVEVSVNAVPRN